MTPRDADLARAAAITRAAIEATADGIMVVDGEGRVLLCNRQFLDMWNTGDALPERTHEEIARRFAPMMKDPPAYVRRVEALYAEPAADSDDLVEFSDGRVYQRFGRPLVLEDGVGRVWSYRDMTTHFAAEAAVRQAKEAAEAANRAKSVFLDNVSHEIRTPLNGVIGLTRLLLAEDLSPQQRRYVELADQSASALLELINDLLDLGKIESGRMELEQVPFRLDQLLRQLADLYRLRAGERELHFVLDVDASVPQAVVGDAGRLRQVLVNLLSNALKFTEEGEFGLMVGRAAAGRGSDVLRFTVWDTGIGIPFEVQPRLFTRFAQADGATSRKYGGTGLGLAIVKQLTEQMGGTVLLQSEPGRGASFRCELPLPATEPAQVPAAPVAATPAAQARGTRVLVAEDNPTNQLVIRGLLVQAGFADVTLVDDGQAALDAIARERFDLVLMDCRMPRLDGYEATRRLRAQGFTPPVIALTANAAAGERERCLAWGMDDYLPKPVDPARLAQVLAQWSGGPTERVAAPAPATAAPAGAFDRAGALHRLGGDEELLSVALGSFREHAPRVLAWAHDALQARDAEALRRHLHSLAGSSGMVGAAPLQAHARQLESAAAGADFDAVQAGWPPLQALFDAFLAASAGG